MESRLRKFMGIGRDRGTSSHAQNRDRQNSSHGSISSQGQASVSSRRSLTRRSVADDRRDAKGSFGLQSVPYENAAAGKAPVFVSTPMKGNGPVKLQASRRLSSGELLATARDSEQTLEDIREGEYIVGGKTKRDSSTRSFRSPTPQYTPAATTGQSHASPKYSSRRPSVASKPSITINTSVVTATHSAAPSEYGLGISTPSGVWGSGSQAQSHRSSLTLSPLSRSCYDADMTQAPSPVDEQNATIAALWKAEYGRLVQMYGHDGAQRNIARLNAIKDRSLPPSPVPLRDHHSRVSIVLEPLPRPVRDKEHGETRRSSDTSATSALYHDDDSDVSSNNRASLISSCAGSSAHTTNTTMTDQEAMVTKEDIRKIVEEMRATYLRAFEASTPSSPKSSQSSRKKRRTKVSPASSNTRTETTTRTRTRTTPISLDRQTWHGHDEAAVAAAAPQKSAQQKHRLTSPSASAFGRLSPVEDSPTRQDSRPRPRLQRADSTTLGSIEAMLTDGPVPKVIASNEAVTAAQAIASPRPDNFF